jgi:hypothetical protein
VKEFCIVKMAMRRATRAVGWLRSNQATMVGNPKAPLLAARLEAAFGAARHNL